MNVIIPHIAIIDPNTLAVLGLKHLLESVMPMMRIDSFASFAELAANHPDRYFHYFVDMRIVLANMPFFLSRRVKTIVLTESLEAMPALDKFHAICVNQPEKTLLRSLLALEQHAHSHGRNLPPMNDNDTEPLNALSQREMEVLALVVKGNINKEIADILNISQATVVTHRKNITAKLGLKNVSSLTVYAVMHGIININDI